MKESQFLYSIMRPSNGSLNRAGNILREDKSNKEAYDIVSNWRVLHDYPLKNFRRSLYRKVAGNKNISKDKKYLTAQRLKRMPTIIDKLFREPKLELSRMQDVGGVRAILETVSQCRELQKKAKNNTSYSVVAEKDYIKEPKIADIEDFI